LCDHRPPRHALAEALDRASQPGNGCWYADEDAGGAMAPS